MESTQQNNQFPRPLKRGHGECPRGKINVTDWLADISDTSDLNAVQVVFKNTRSGFYSNPQGLDLKVDDIVAVEASPGHDIGRVALTGKLVERQMARAGVSRDSELKKVFRIATERDLEKFDEAVAREHDTMIRARKIAEDLGLSMKIGDVEYQGDGGKAIFYYIADERVDFRKLIRILADTFKIRIEMKQIGARQEAGRIGGIGPCGRPLCCSTWMNHFVSVGTGAARLQDLSMNPQKLAGQCAKLKCCLNFEIDTYSEASKKMPPKDVVLETKDCDYYFFKPDILARTVTYSTDKNIPANLVTIPASRAFEIIALNRQGIKVDTLEAPGKDVPQQKEYIDLVEQESLTRFDKSKKARKKGNQQPQGSKSQKQEKSDRQEKSGRQEKSDRQPRADKAGRAETPKANEKQQNQRNNKGNQNQQQRKRPGDTQQNQPGKPSQQQSDNRQPQGNNDQSQRQQRRHHNKKRKPSEEA